MIYHYHNEIYLYFQDYILQVKNDKIIFNDNFSQDQPHNYKFEIISKREKKVKLTELRLTEEERLYLLGKIDTIHPFSKK